MAKRRPKAPKIDPAAAFCFGDPCPVCRHRRLEHAADVGSGDIVTFCPKCGDFPTDYDRTARRHLAIAIVGDMFRVRDGSNEMAHRLVLERESGPKLDGAGWGRDPLIDRVAKALDAHGFDTL